MRKVLAIIMILTAVTTVSAQSKWTYKLGFGGEMKSGNVNTTIFNTNAGVERNDSVLSFDANVAYVYGMQEKQEYENNFTGNMKFDLWQYDRWSPFVNFTYNYNEYKGYWSRYTGLAGVKYRIYWNSRCDYSLSGAYVFEYTDYIVKEGAPQDQVSRLSLRFKVKEKIADAVTLKHTTFYMPSFYDFTGDWAVTSTTSLSTQLNKYLSLALNFTYEYHSLVPEGVEKQDIVTSATLNLKF